MNTVEEARKLVSVEEATVDEIMAQEINLVIVDQPGYDAVVTHTKAVRKMAKEIEDRRKAFVKPIREMMKQVQELFVPPINRLKQYEDGLKKTCSAWLTKQEQIRLEEQRKREEEAQKERERLEAEARRKREEERIARAKAEEAARKAQVAKTIEEQERLNAVAEEQISKAESAANNADAREAMSANTVAEKVSTTTQKSGVYQVTTYEPVIRNKGEFISWCLSSGMLEYLKVDLSLLKSEATKTKGQRQWPGITIKQSSSARLRS